MKANELRIGNYYYGDVLFPSEYNVITANDLVELDSDPLDDYYQPLPLTEEWLLKFGFEKEKNIIKIYTKSKISIYLDCEEYPNGRVYFNSWCILKEKVKNVHQLQNLYFALTNEELTIM